MKTETQNPEKSEIDWNQFCKMGSNWLFPIGRAEAEQSAFAGEAVTKRIDSHSIASQLENGKHKSLEGNNPVLTLVCEGEPYIVTGIVCIKAFNEQVGEYSNSGFGTNNAMAGRNVEIVEGDGVKYFITDHIWY